MAALFYIDSFPIIDYFLRAVDFEFIKQVIPLYIEAAGLTLHLALIGIILSFAVGLLCALIRYYKVPVLSPITGFYIELSRNTPLLIQLFFLYFALPNLGIKLSSFQCCIIGLTFLGGSYMEETFRSALETVSKVQIESGQCIGLSGLQVMRYVVLPQAVSVLSDPLPHTSGLPQPQY